MFKRSYALYDNHVAMLLDEAVYHSEHLRLGIRDQAAREDTAPAAELAPASA
jgi:hypothetical protein